MSSAAHTKGKAPALRCKGVSVVKRWLLMGWVLLASPAWLSAVETWRSILGQYGAESRPAGIDLDAGITSGSVFDRDGHLVVAYYEMKDFSAPVESYILLDLDRESGAWSVHKIVPETGGSIVTVVRSELGYVVGHHHHMIGTFDKVALDGRLLGEFQALECSFLPDGRILALAWGHFGSPCLVSVHTMDRSGGRCLVAAESVKGAPYEPEGGSYSGGVEANFPVYLFDGRFLILNFTANNPKNSSGPWIATACLDEGPAAGRVLDRVAAKEALGEDWEPENPSLKSFVRLAKTLGCRPPAPDKRKPTVLEAWK